MRNDAEHGATAQPELNALSVVSQDRSKQIDIWREAMSQLRQLHGDVWNGVRFFLTLNTILFAGMAALARELTGGGSIVAACVIGLLAVAGCLATLIARGILSDHRRYYVGMLVLKTLIEKELKFYEVKLAGVDLCFPWNVESQHLEALQRDPTGWRCDHQWRPGTISRKLRHVYDGVVVLHGIVLLAVLGFLFWSSCHRP